MRSAVAVVRVRPHHVPQQGDARGEHGRSGPFHPGTVSTCT